MSFILPKLPYPLNALEPFISEQTLEFHYGKHHKTYVDKLNGLIAGTDLENSSLEHIIMHSDGGIFNNAAQVWNHTFYWDNLKPNGGGQPVGKMAGLIDKKYGSFNEFKEQFTQAAITLFGSGWVWLVLTSAGNIDIVQESNVGNPLTKGLKPLMTCDVWEHAYYLDKQNRRPAYIEDFWKILNWNAVEGRLG